MRERDIFIAALEETDDTKRPAVLAAACGDDLALHQRVERLLEEHERAATFILDSPAAELEVTITTPISEQPGTVIGPYKLLQQIGEGGMGIVFMAAAD